ncbi:MAG: antitoxin HicB [Microbacteriaceae bacterium]
MSKRTFEVVAERDGRWWVFDIPELGTGGQAHNLAEVEYEAQGVAAMWLNVEPATVTVTVAVKGQERTLTEWITAEHDEEEARRAQARAAARRRAVVRSLRAEGYSAPDAGRILGISKQRVYQIERADAEVTSAR